MARPTPPPSLARRLLDQAFAVARAPRSPPYRLGVYHMLLKALQGEHLACPFKLGTADADAWFAGCNEGRRIASQHKMPAPAGRAAA